MQEKTLFRVTWTARRSNQSILKEINFEYSLEELMLKLKLQYFGPLIRRADPLEKTLMLGKIENKRRRRWQRMRQLDSTTDSTNMSLSKLQEILKSREVWRAAVHEVTKSPTWLSYWTTTIIDCLSLKIILIDVTTTECSVIDYDLMFFQIHGRLNVLSDSWLNLT